MISTSKTTLITPFTCAGSRMLLPPIGEPSLAPSSGGDRLGRIATRDRLQSARHAWRRNRASHMGGQSHSADLRTLYRNPTQERSPALVASAYALVPDQCSNWPAGACLLESPRKICDV